MVDLLEDFLCIVCTFALGVAAHLVGKKPHCPDCGGVMDGDQLDMTLDKVVYTCRNCKKEWI